MYSKTSTLTPEQFNAFKSPKYLLTLANEYERLGFICLL